MSTFNAASTKPIYHGTQIVWFILSVVQVLLGLRFILKLLGANPAAVFTDIVYTLSGILVSPFVAVFRTTYVEGSVFEWTTILAALIYWLIAIGIVRMFLMSQDVSTPEAAVRLQDQE